MSAPAAHATDTSTPRASFADAGSNALREFTPEQIDEAIAEAKAGGYVEHQATGASGDITTTLDLGDGFRFDLVQADPKQRLGAGSDSAGVYVSLNATDQNMIISGATFGIAAGLCAVSAGTFCVVAGAIITAATVAITQNGGVRCSGGKALRVYPFSGAKPRCV